MYQYNHTFWVWIGIIVGLVGQPSSARAQFALPENTERDVIDPIYAIVDIMTARGNVIDSTRIDCYYRLSNELFNFIKSGEKFVSHYELSLLVNDDKGYQILAETVRDSITVDTEVETQMMDNSRAKMFTTYLPPGKYDLEFKLYDIDTARQLDMVRSFKVPNYFKNKLSISDIQFAGLVTSEPSTIGLNKRGLTVVPNLTRSYGEEHTELYIYYEIYTEAKADTKKALKTTYKIKSPTGRIILTQEEELERQGPVGAYSMRFDTEDFSQGRYSLEIEVEDKDVRKTAKSKADFYISWQYLLPLTTAKHFKEIVDQLEYIAERDEIELLKKLKEGPGDEQHIALYDFWKRRDPTPETDQNEFMIMYYRRIEYANSNFRMGLGKGWRSDQGRIYIIFGPPNEVERFTFESATNPYQVWHYNNISRRFVFVDFDGYGRYQLYRVY